MKILIFLFFPLLCFSQNYRFTGISVISPNKDTLWIINDDIGKLIESSWDIPSSVHEDKPVILLVERLPIIEEKNKIRYIKGN